MAEPTQSPDADARIAQLGDWRGELLARLRTLILSAGSGSSSSNHMLGVPTWSCDGLIWTGEPYTDTLNLTFARGASVDDAAFVALIRATVAANG